MELDGETTALAPSWLSFDGSVAQAGTLAALGAVTMTIDGSLDNQGTIQMPAGGILDATAISNQATMHLQEIDILTDVLINLGGGAAITMSGDYDVAIDDSARYDMDQATLRMAGAEQSLEVMSLDVGSDASGLDGTPAGHFPIGTLRVAAGSVTTLVDAHDNDLMGQKLCEALYVRTLIVDAGAVLNTYGCPVYYESSQLDGAVDDLGDLFELPPPCPWDLTGDSIVGVNDFLSLLALWGTDPGGPPDFNDDGNVGVADFLELLANWGSCPSV